MYHQNYNQRLMAMEEEVLWLHSLWHAGSFANPNLRVSPNSLPINKKKNQKKKNKKKAIEWPCEPPADAPSPPPGEWVSWGSAAPPPTHAPKAPSCEELALYKALQVQQKGISASKLYLGNMESSDDEDEEDYDDHELDGSSKHVGFFLDLFEKDDELRNYFKQNYEKGEFCCFVCAGMGKKFRKTYGDCMSLVHHANSIAKMEGRRAHRALAKVICQVIGWDVERLPTIIFSCSKESTLSQIGASNSTPPDCFTVSPCKSPENPLVDASINWNDGNNTSSPSPVMCQTPNDKEKMKITAMQEEEDDVHREACPHQD